MALTVSQKTDLLFKKFAAKRAATSESKEFFLEGNGSIDSIDLVQIWLDSDLIPASHGLVSNDEIYAIDTQDVLQYKIDTVLTKMPGVNSFSSASINSVVSPYIHGTNYNWTFKDGSNNPINIYKTGADGFFDPDSGILTFYGDLPTGVTTTVTITCVLYVGRDGATLGDAITIAQSTKDISSVLSIIDATDETTILLTTGNTGERYLVIDASSSQDNQILYWNLIEWSYVIPSSELKNGHILVVDNNLNDLLKWFNGVWQIITFERTMPAHSNINMSALLTDGDCQLATSPLIIDQPIFESYVGVFVNGEKQRVANGYVPATELDLDSKQFDCGFGDVSGNLSNVTTPGANQLDYSAGDFITLNLLVGDYIFIRTIGLDEHFRKITAIDGGNNRVTYDGTNISSPLTSDKFIIRAYGEVLVNDSLRWFPRYASYQLDTDDWIDFDYVRHLTEFPVSTGLTSTFGFSFDVTFS